mgnify:CR=1 FL=1
MLFRSQHNPWLAAAGGALFLAKCWALAGVVLLVRASVPRIRPDVLLRLGVKVIIPACLAGAGLTFLALRYPLLPAAERALGVITMATVSLTGLWVLRFVQSSVRAGADEARLRARVNPLL